MLFITDNEFERVVSRARNRDIAREYYRKDYVVNVSITIDSRGYYHISGKVMINGNIYLPRILVNRDSKIVSTDCNCIYADEYTAYGNSRWQTLDEWREKRKPMHSLIILRIS